LFNVVLNVIIQINKASIRSISSYDYIEQQPGGGDIIMETKTCKKCKVIQSIDSFYKNPLLKSGVSNQCKLCTKEQSKKYKKPKQPQAHPRIIDLDGEVWKDIPGFECFYQISNKGRVKSLPRERKHNLWGSIFYDRERVMRQRLGNHGYYSAMLTKNGIKKTFQTHRLIAEAFIPNPKKLPAVNHKNGIKHDNLLDNLEWVSTRENVSHYYQNNHKSSRYIGVSWNKERRKWTATICINGDQKYLGLFIKEKDAYRAYINTLNENKLTNKYATT